MGNFDVNLIFSRFVVFFLLQYDAYMKMRLDQVEEDWDAKLADIQAHFDVDSSPSSANYDAATKEQHEALLHRLGYKQQFRLTQ